MQLVKSKQDFLNAGKTELVIFLHPNKKINYEFKIKINGKKIYESNYVKYLGILIDSHLNWIYHLNSVSTKSARANGMLSKIRHYINQTKLSSIYHAIFASILKYGAEIWGQHSNRFLNRIEELQNRALKTITFSNSRDPVLPLYKSLKILQLSDHIKIKIFLLVHDYINNNLPLAFNDIFQLTKNIHSHSTRNATHYNLRPPIVNTNKYGLHSINYKNITTWNSLQNKYATDKFHLCQKSLYKQQLTDYYIQSY